MISIPPPGMPEGPQPAFPLFRGLTCTWWQVKDSNLRSFRNGFTVPTPQACDQRERLSTRQLPCVFPTNSRRQPLPAGHCTGTWTVPRWPRATANPPQQFVADPTQSPAQRLTVSRWLLEALVATTEWSRYRASGTGSIDFVVHDGPERGLCDGRPESAQISQPCRSRPGDSSTGLWFQRVCLRATS